MGNSDELEVFQVLAQSGGSVALELEIINHDGDSGDTTNNTDIDIYVVDTEEVTVSSGAGLGKTETAEIPAGNGTIYYLIIDHWRGYNTVPSSYVITQTPNFATSTEQKEATDRSNADFSLDKILVVKKSMPPEMVIDFNATENELLESMGNRSGGLVEITPEELSNMAGLPADESYSSRLKEDFPDAHKKGRWQKALSILQSRSPSLAIEPDWKIYTHADPFVADPSYNTYQWWNFDVTNLPEGLDIIGQEVKPVNVGVLDSGSPSLDDPSFERSTFLPDWGWDMEDNDTNPMDEEFLLSDFSHGIHVGSTIAMLNDGLDGNGMGARITPIRVCYQGGCGNTYDAYLFVNGDANQSNTYFKERVGDNLGIPVNQVTEKLHSINMSYGGGGSQTSQACVKLAELSETGILVVSSSGNSGIGSIGYPSSCPTVYSIGATNGTDRRSSYSSTNQYIDFAAPGGEYSDWNADGVDDLVYAYAYWENYVMNSNNGNYMIGAQGTSMASPHAAGILGLIKYYYEEVAKPFQTNTSLPTVLKYTQVDKMLRANLLTNDVNKEARDNDPTARPGWDEHLGYGIIDLEKSLKSINAFNSGYFTSFDNLPYYEGPSLVALDAASSYEGTFTITPNGAAGPGFNTVSYTYVDEFLDVTDNGSTFTVKKDPDYSWAGWVNTPITFSFPMEAGAGVPYDGYELLSVGVNVIFHVIGDAYDVNFPTLKARLLDDVGVLVAESTSSVTDGVGAFVFDELTAGTYRLSIGSDINGDNSWGGPGEMSGSSDLFQITDTNVTVDINLAPEKTGVANSAPVITSNPTTVAFVGSTYIYGVDASDADDDDLTYTLTVYDSSGDEVDSFLSFGAFPWPATTLSGTPTADDIGVYTVRIVVTDGTDAAVQEYSLEVKQS